MERSFVRWLVDQSSLFPGTSVGIGDDGSVHPWEGGQDQIVVTTDLLVEGTHFILAEAGARRVGRKAIAVNLSDLAAMAARPVACWVSLLAPRGLTTDDLQQLYAGISEMSRQHQMTLAGGDTNAGGDLLVLSVTVMGATQPPLWLRSGAQPGDRVLVSGQLGGSLLGHHLDFEPRIRAALELHGRYDVHAAMDISDGLTLDLDRMTEASRCGAMVDLERVPISAAAMQLAQTSGQSALQHALSDGEDFELLLAVAPDEAHRMIDARAGGLEWSDVGEFVAGRGLLARNGPGPCQPLAARGYLHGS